MLHTRALPLAAPTPCHATPPCCSISPNVHGHTDVKRAILLMLLGGMHKTTKEVGAAPLLVVVVAGGGADPDLRQAAAAGLGWVHGLGCGGASPAAWPPRWPRRRADAGMPALHPPQGINLRGDINVAIVGDPACAKSQMLKCARGSGWEGAGQDGARAARPRLRRRLPA